MKLPWQHADDRPRGAIQHDYLPQDILFPTIFLLPHGVSQYDGAWRARQVFTGTEIASQHWSDSEGAKESVAHASALPGLRTLGSRQDKTCVLIRL